MPRLKRIDATWTLDANLFSQLTWLVIEQPYRLDRTPAERAMPFLSERGGRDWGEIVPHRLRLLRAMADASAVEDALFAMLLAPWEDWVGVDWPKRKDRVEGPTRYWRAFDVPWVYHLDNDIFARPAPPPPPDALSWDQPIVNEEGEEVFGSERPERLPLKPAVANASEWLNDARWAEIMRARQTRLFSKTPISHFFVRAFLEEDPLDEFLAHMLTIEAALGLESDYRRASKSTGACGSTSSTQPPTKQRAKSRGATRRMAARVSGLLGGQARGRDYCCLFNIRSAFLHGRKMDTIPSEQRVTARRLAREVVNALATAALTEPSPTIPASVPGGPGGVDVVIDATALSPLRQLDGVGPFLISILVAHGTAT